MHFITYYDLNKDLVDQIHRIPKDIDIVVGVPRSGLMVATIVGLYLNKPITDIDSFLEGRYYEIGSTKPRTNMISSFADIKKALVVEDTICSGRSIAGVKARMGGG